ncbi:VC0807 family protein [Clostridium sp. YIM B02551]|uniref:VC0807 family protein n=1 Tax=Clostridium sp. YIM B02551 TaxID=2910679 RepID=UPI001EEB3E3F|nr:VC0807 family protein [Clostridium sp. YIM B02551]
MEAKKRLIKSLGINMIVPFVLYMVLSKVFTTETIPLTIASAFPTIRTIILFLWKGKIDWIGIFVAIGFIVAVIASTIFGGASLPLKLVHPIIFSIIGIAFIISVLIEKPLIVFILKFINKGRDEHINSKTARKKFSLLTGAFGGIFLAGAIIHIALAIILPTSIYLVISHFISWGTIATLIISGKLITKMVTIKA